jgi:hypothetical protein
MRYSCLGWPAAVRRKRTRQRRWALRKVRQGLTQPNTLVVRGDQPPLTSKPDDLQLCTEAALVFDAALEAACSLKGAARRMTI